MKAYRYDVAKGEIYCNEKLCELPPDEVEQMLFQEGFRNIRTYSNIPEYLIPDTLIGAAEKLKSSEVFLIPLGIIPRLLEAVVEKCLNPYALFVQD